MATTRATGQKPRPRLGVHAEHARYTSTLGVKSPYWRSALWPALVGIGSGVFMSPNAAAMQPAHVEAGT